MPNGIRKIFVSVITVLMLLSAQSAMSRDVDNDDLLIVSAYSTQYNWSSRVVNKLETIVHANHKNVSTLNLPLASVNTIEGIDSLTNVLSKVIAERSPKAVALVGSGSFMFCEDIDSICPDMSMILIGGQEYTTNKRRIAEERLVTPETMITTDELREKFNVTSQCMPVYPGETAELIVRMMPNLKNLYFVSGDDVFSRTKGRELEQHMRKFHTGISYKMLNANEMNSSDLVDVISKLKRDTDAVIYSSWLNQKAFSRSITLMNNALYLLEVSKAPIFVIRDNGWIADDNRVIGGCVYDEDAYFSILEDVVVKVLNGVPARDIPFNDSNHKIIKLDYRQLVHYGLDEDNCPPKTVFVNKINPFWNKYGEWIMVGIYLLVLFAMMLVIGYMRKLVQYRELRIKELEINRRFVNLVENMPIVYFRAQLQKNAQGVLTDMLVNFGNHNVKKFFKTINKSGKPTPLTEALPHATPMLLSTVTKAIEDGLKNVDVVVDIWTGAYYAMYISIDGDSIDAFGVDISDTISYQIGLENLNNDLVKAKEEAEISERMKTEFIQNMSHEIRTPLNAICGFVEMLTDDSPDNPLSDQERKEYSNIIKTNSGVLMNLVNDILDFSDLNSGRAKVVIMQVPVNDLCRLALHTVELRVSNRVKLQFESNVGDDYNISTDPKRVQQVLVNFLTNAIKHTDEGSITLGFTGKDDEGWCEFSVTDTGEGIPEDKADEIFERFLKLNSFKQGTGLGLAICKSVANVLDGEVALDTSYKQGARFVFRLKNIE